MVVLIDRSATFSAAAGKILVLVLHVVLFSKCDCTLFLLYMAVGVMIEDMGDREGGILILLGQSGNASDGAVVSKF